MAPGDHISLFNVLHSFSTIGCVCCIPFKIITTFELFIRINSTDCVKTLKTEWHPWLVCFWMLSGLWLSGSAFRWSSCHCNGTADRTLKPILTGPADVAIQRWTDHKVGKTITIAAFQYDCLIDATGMYVTPGPTRSSCVTSFFRYQSQRLISSNSYTALPPDGFTFRAGVTAVGRCRR